MSNMLSTVIHDDFVWSAISGALTGTRRGSNGATMINCPMCILRGHPRPDTRHRCGVTRRSDGVIIHCYNCDFATEYVLGEAISQNMRNFMERIGIPSRTVQHIKHKALQYRRLISSSPEAQAIIPTFHKPNFPAMALPDGAYPISDWASNGVVDPDFLAVANYMFTRGDSIANPDVFYWSPLKENDINRRLLIPFTHEGKIVGYTGRLIDKGLDPNKHPKYWTQCPVNYLYNNEVLDNDWKYVFVVEGPLDAKAIDGVATLGAKLTDEQAHWLNTCGKTPVLIADRDKSGQRLIDHALTNNWLVSFPRLKEGKGFNNWWEPTVKDPAEAVETYGKLYTVRSIIETIAKSKTEVSVKRQWLY